MEKKKFEELFEALVDDVINGNVDVHNYYRIDHYKEIVQEFYGDIQKFSCYTFDDKLDNLIIKSLINVRNYNYNYQIFLNFIKEELKQLSVPCIILIPLNFFDDNTLIEDLTLSNELKIFKTDKNRECFFKRNKSQITEYVNKVTHSNLSKKYILREKDNNFFNYPIMSIKIYNIATNVENNSSNIVSALYSLIRLLDFSAEGNDYLRDMSNNYLFPARTYCLYCNELDIQFDVDYGYFMRPHFSPILDINTQAFLNKKELFTQLMTKFISFSFEDKIILPQEVSLKHDKWKNAVLLFNNAYEFASYENYDASLLIIITILESLFLNNSGTSKKSQLIEQIGIFVKGKNIDFENNIINEIINFAYSARNRFVHEGKTIDTKKDKLKNLHDIQGMYAGMKPFKYVKTYNKYNIKTLFENLFELTKIIICNYI